MAAVETMPVPIAAPLEEARAYLRLGANGDDAVVTGLLRAATSVCEQFTGMALVRRLVTEVVAVNGAWQRLAVRPVTAIVMVEGMPDADARSGTGAGSAASGATFVLPPSHYAIDIDASGDGWVRVMQPGAAGRVRVTYEAGLAASAGVVPDALRQGIIMLVAQMVRDRDRDRDGGSRDSAGGVPPATAALWRAWRRMRLGNGSRSVGSRGDDRCD